MPSFAHFPDHLIDHIFSGFDPLERNHRRVSKRFNAIAGAKEERFWRRRIEGFPANSHIFLVQNNERPQSPEQRKANVQNLLNVEDLASKLEDEHVNDPIVLLVAPGEHEMDIWPTFLTSVIMEPLFPNLGKSNFKSGYGMEVLEGVTLVVNGVDFHCDHFCPLRVEGTAKMRNCFIKGENGIVVHEGGVLDIEKCHIESSVMNAQLSTDNTSINIHDCVWTIDTTKRADGMGIVLFTKSAASVGQCKITKCVLPAPVTALQPKLVEKFGIVLQENKIVVNRTIWAALSDINPNEIYNSAYIYHHA